MKIVDRPSPNFNDRPPGRPVDILLLHYTGMKTAADALDRLCDPAAQVSAHYTVDEDGTVYAHVQEAKRAWHAGASRWGDDTDINGLSVGIEIVNPGHEFGYRAFPDIQIASVIALSQAVLARHPIPPGRVLGHSDVAPARKQDPGELFPWAKLASTGIGVWPDEFAAPAGGTPDVRQVQQDLAAFGYACPTNGTDDAATRTVVTAFQRHFRPANVDGRIDPETASIARHLAKIIGE